MRIRNGADFLEATIRSHIDAFDEIVAVYNQCTDATPEILARLASELGPRLRVIHYADRVYPPGSADHAKEPASSPHSLVNYYNFALARTRFAHATKLDDDHLAIEPGLTALVDGVRRGTFGTEMSCFSGFNLARRENGSIGVLASDPFSGGGDIGVFPVSAATHFTHDRRFERFQRGGLKRAFRGIVYWHLKLLKSDMGFGNYELAGNRDSRYAKKLAALEAERRVVDVEDVQALMSFADRSLMVARNLGFPLPGKAALKADRWSAAVQGRSDAEFQVPTSLKPSR